MRIDAADFQYLLKDMTPLEAFTMGVTVASMNGASLPLTTSFTGATTHNPVNGLVLLSGTDYARLNEQARKYRMLHGDEDPRDQVWQNEWRAGKKVEAIRQYRALYNVGLKEAKDAVELWGNSGIHTPPN